ncbi:oxysterol-binding protein-like protein [Xylogone sp. PMI_703]|nr:oxysterol-binding protein-like protein [Xylogone sp. PMI_703]
MTEHGDHHKRSKSSAISLLRRKDTRDEDNASEESSIAGPQSASISRQQSYSHVSKLSTSSVSLMRSISGNVQAQAQTQTQTQTVRNGSFSGPSAEKPVSIEQSVRKFRVFEALRNGDTASISKAIRELQANSNGATGSSNPAALEDTTILHLAIQCAEVPVVEYILSYGAGTIDINARDKDGNTPLHIAALQGRSHIVRLLLDQPDINDSIANYQGRLPLDLARTPDIFQQLQLSRSIFVDQKVKEVQDLVAYGEYQKLGELLEEPRVKTVIDINSGEFASDPTTVQSGGTLLHEAARRRNIKLIQVLLLHGADPFRRDRKGKLPQDVTKDEHTRAMLKRSPAAVAAQRGIQEKAVLGNVTQNTLNNSPGDPLVGKEGREMKGYLKKWTNYRKGYQLRWFVLEDGVLSYYKHQDDAGSACRGAINMRIAKLSMDPTEKQKFEILGKSSVKYHLKANHEVEAKRWFWALNNSIQWSKDQAKEEDKQRAKSAEMLKQAKAELTVGGFGKEAALTDHSGDTSSYNESSRSGVQGKLTPQSAHARSGSQKVAFVPGGVEEEENAALAPYELSSQGDLSRMPTNNGTAPTEGDYDDEDYGDDSSERDAPASKDAFDITAQSAKMQLEVMGQVHSAIQAELTRNPGLTVSDPVAAEAISTFDASIRNLKVLLGDLLKISKDRDAYWQYRLDREADMRRMWEESMAQVAHEQELLEAKVGEAELKRKLTKRALREVIDGNVIVSQANSTGEAASIELEITDTAEAAADAASSTLLKPKSTLGSVRRKSILTEITNLSDSESEEEDEFFDAVDAGEVELAPMPLQKDIEAKQEIAELDGPDLSSSFLGYENGIRKRLKMDADDRPKISLWGILKSMIGKDMTKMTLPVSFNEPTSLLQRCAEDMEYADLLDIAAQRTDPCERMVYVAAFAASEYASTIGRVAKPFNPLLGETFEYARPDKQYRFFIEQVSHHPPIGAAWAESPRWTYYGESAVKSKFYGKSFDINPLGTWFLKLRPANGDKEELYTWKKVTSSVIGIITGSPTVDNYGPMDIKNWTTGEVCNLDFKARGWKASSAYQITGRVNDSQGRPRFSIGGRWNSKIWARFTPGYEATVEEPKVGQRANTLSETSNQQAFLVWEANPRPSGIPFNLTPFVLTLNDINDQLRPWLAPTDTRLRPDQRAMEDGEYDLAATEKNRVEEKQRAKRREREAKGEEFSPRWFSKAKDLTTGEMYWKFNHEYWKEREKALTGEAWKDVEDIF